MILRLFSYFQFQLIFQLLYFSNFILDFFCHLLSNSFHLLIFISFVHILFHSHRVYLHFLMISVFFFFYLDILLLDFRRKLFRRKALLLPIDRWIHRGKCISGCCRPTLTLWRRCLLMWPMSTRRNVVSEHVRFLARRTKYSQMDEFLRSTIWATTNGKRLQTSIEWQPPLAEV